MLVTSLKKIIFHPLMVILVTLLALVIIVSLRNKLNRLTLSQQNLKNVQQEVSQASLNLQEKQSLLEKAQQPLAMETLTRDELLMQKEGELAIKLPNIEIISAEPEATHDLSPVAQWQQLLFAIEIL